MTTKKLVSQKKLLDCGEAKPQFIFNRPKSNYLSTRGRAESVQDETLSWVLVGTSGGMNTLSGEQLTNYTTLRFVVTSMQYTNLLHCQFCGSCKYDC